MSNRQWPALPERVLGKVRGRKRRARQLARAGFIGALSAAMGVAGAGTAGAVEPDPGDLEFILQQIVRAEAHPDGDVFGPNATTDVIHPQLPEGLRTVTGVYNNLIPGQKDFGAADTVFPRELAPLFRVADDLTFDWDGPGPQAVGQTSTYASKTGVVEDSDPRVISNLIVDMTGNNPAAVAAAAQNPNAEGIDHDNNPATPNLFRIPNRAPDEGLSAPYNAWFTAFGQFFDHGLDLVTKGGGTVVMPLQPDDPLYTPGAPTNFMVLTRATNQPGPDGTLGTQDDVQEHTNTTSPFVDQNQTYTSHPSHQVFLRDYERNAANEVVSNGRLLDSAAHGGGLVTWAEVKQQAAQLLGIQLVDADVHNVPLLKTDAYGKFTPGPNGYPQFELNDGTFVEADPAADGNRGMLVPADAKRTGHAFLDDIAHSAVPVGDLDRNPRTPPTSLTPDADTVASTPDAPLPAAGEYDNELLDAHFITGDGRGNENIGLTAVHHVFHTEHNLLVDEIKALINAEEVKRPGFKAGWEISPGAWDGERLFQAARFMTEMQYQHLVFEEFARKVQPQVDVFGAYQTDIDPAITAEFAHTVYRFGHSMLTEQLSRRSANGQVRQVDLLDAFLNPLSFNDDGNGGQLTPNEAAGTLARGLTSQVGNEIDEFVTDGVRNNLLGLPLDLAAINIARARDTGVPSFNSARRQFYEATNEPALRPYESWTDFGLGLRHPESLVNFIAAYGTHPSITGATTLAAKRAAAQLLVDGGVGAPADRVAFLESTGAVWGSDANGVTNTGLDDVDFWIGGLAEKQMPFGGLLGSTFNFVFETQMEKLQDGDRLYYLTRTAGLNFLTQLEENSFAELVMRTTDATHLPFDVFSHPDYTFELRNLGTSGPILDDAETPYDESVLLTRLNGTVRFDGPEHVLMGGTPANNRMRTGDGDDTIWGDGGNDRVEGGAGNDSLNGNQGDDIVTDLFGDDNIKAGNGHDAVNAGSGIDLILAGAGRDFVIAGSDPKETFAGGGDDFVIAGRSADTVFGNQGDDWIEGGSQADALNGEHAEPFFDDDVASHDVMNGQGGPDELHAEGGDDILVQSPGQDFNEGMLGFDWSTQQGDPGPGISDLANSGLVQPARDNLFDFFDLVEGASGWKNADIVRGDSTAGDDAARAGHQLNQAGIDLIDGLDAVVGSVAPGTIGNVLLGGDSDDILEGRGGNDVIDGDSWLNVELQAPNPDTQDPTDTQLVDGMQQLQADVFAGRINAGDIKVVRSIEVTPRDSDVDTAVFTGLSTEYQITRDHGTVTVTHLNGGVDGTDTLRNVERAQFATGTPGIVETVELSTVPGNQPATGTVDITGQPMEGQALTAVNAFDDVDGISNVTADPSLVTYEWQVEFGQGATRRWTSAGGPSGTFTPNDAQVGKRLRVVASFPDDAGVTESVVSAPTGAVTNANDAAAGSPAVDSAPYQVRKELTANVSGITDEDGLAGATYRYQWQVAGTPAVDIPGANGRTFTPSDADAGKDLQVVVSFTDDKGAQEQRTSAPFTVVAAAPDAPTIQSVLTGAGSATLTWNAPARNGGSAVTGYEITVLDSLGAVERTVTVGPLVTQRTLTGLVDGSAYSFRVAAVNSAGTGAASAASGPVTIGARLASAPRDVVAKPGVRSAKLRWTAPVDNGGTPITGYKVQVLTAAGAPVGNPLSSATTSLVVDGLTNRRTYKFDIWAVNVKGDGAAVRSGAVTPANLPGAPRIKSPSKGVGGGDITVTARWDEPRRDGGSAITGYRVVALRVTGDGWRKVQQRLSSMVGPRERSLRMVVPDGVYRINVRAYNAIGRGKWSGRSNAVEAR